MAHINSSISYRDRFETQNISVETQKWPNVLVTLRTFSHSVRTCNTQCSMTTRYQRHIDLPFLTFHTIQLTPNNRCHSWICCEFSWRRTSKIKSKSMNISHHKPHVILLSQCEAFHGWLLWEVVGKWRYGVGCWTPIVSFLFLDS